MGKKVQAPPSPDYAAAAAAQGQANTSAAQQSSVLGNPNVTTPNGFQQVGYNDIPNPNYNPNDPNSQQFFLQPTITQQLQPEQQQVLENTTQAQIGLSNLANQQVGNISNILNQPFQFNGQVQTSLPYTGQVSQARQPDVYTQLGLEGGPNLFALGGAGGFNGSQYNPMSAFLNAPQLSNSINTSGVAQLPVNAGTTAQQAIMSRLQPSLDRQRTSTETQLINQGLRPGDEAYNNAINVLGQQENDARTQAVLQGLGLDFQANQQGFNQALQQGAFGNQAALSGFGAGLQNLGQYNAAQGQGFGQGLAGQQLSNQALGQNQQAALAAQQAQNAAQSQEFGQTQQGYQNQLAYQQAQNAAQQQAFNQALQSGQFGNTANQQALAQGLTLYNQPLNAITALMSGSQINSPQYQPYNGASVAPAPVFAGTQAQAAWDQNLYNQQVAQRNSLLGGLFGIGGSLLGGAGAAGGFGNLFKF